MHTIRLPGLIRSAVIAAAAVSGVACGGSSGDPVATAQLFAVNGARYPAVFAEDTATWVGFGFGAAEDGGAVLVTAGGTLSSAEVVSWRDGEIRAVLPATVETGATYVLTPRDTLGPLDLFVRQRTTYDPAQHTWVTDAALPVRLAAPGAGAVRFPTGGTVTGLVVLSGGRLPDGRLSADTYLGTVTAEGRISEWRAAPDTIVPAPRRLHTIVAADRTTAAFDEVESVAYMLGGVDSAGRVLADALGLGLSSTGTYTFWTPLAPLPDRRAGVAAVVAFGKLYAIGGFGSDSLASRGVAYATILPVGTLNGWFLGPPLPEGRAFAAAAVAGNRIFVLGGELGAVAPDAVADTTGLTATIYTIRVSPRSGAFQDTAWTELAVTLRVPRTRFAAYAVDDALVVTGGVYPGMPSGAETEYAPLVGGLPAAFVEQSGTTLAELAGGPVWSFAAPVVWTANGITRVTVIGGRRADSASAQVFSQ